MNESPASLGTPRVPSSWSGEHRALTVGIVPLIALTAFEGIGTATAMPLVARELDALSSYTWAFNAFVVASLLGMVIGGLWSDAAGPRGPVIAGIGTFTAGAVLAGAAAGLPLLVTGRALQGFGAGAVIVAVYVLIARSYSVEMRPKAFAILSQPGSCPGWSAR